MNPSHTPLLRTLHPSVERNVAVNLETVQFSGFCPLRGRLRHRGECKHNHKEEFSQSHLFDTSANLSCAALVRAQ